MPSFRRPSAATVQASVALVAALSSPAVAARLVTSADIQNNTIRSADVRDGELRSRDIRNGGIGVQDLAPGARNAERLDGLDAAAFQRRCSHGTIFAWATIAARASFPNAWTSDPTLVPSRYSCLGTPEVRRTSGGVYLVRVPGINLALTAAVATPYGALEGADNSIAVQRIQYEATTVWRVVIRDVAAGRAIEEGEFTVAIL